jgi:uncharacterized protein YjcR
MAYKQATIDTAQELYLQGMKPERVAEILSVPVRTIYNWVDKGEWNKGNNSSILLSAKIRTKMRQMVEAALDDGSFESTEFADKMSKLQKIADRLNPEGQMLGNIFAFLEGATEVMTRTNDNQFIDTWKKLIPEVAEHLKLKYQK